jgi:hypothetical protein
MPDETTIDELAARLDRLEQQALRAGLDRRERAELTARLDRLEQRYEEDLGNLFYYLRLLMDSHGE